MTYASLSAQILDYLDRNDADTAAAVPNFIYQAEQRISREVKNIGLETYVNGTFAIGQNILLKPARWRRTLSLTYGSGTNNNVSNQIYLRTYEYVKSYWPDSVQESPPLYYADFGYDHIIVAPTPDQKYPFIWSYLQLPEPLGPTVSTNWITNNAPDLLLYASLLEAIPFLKVDERIPFWQSLYDRSLQSLNTQDTQRYSDRVSVRESD
jgi:hypothetical protein